MMCRVIAPVAALFRREAVSRLRLRHPTPLHRRLRIVRHRAVRWFRDPIASRRDREFGPSLWRYDFRPWPALLHAEAGRQRRGPIPIRRFG